MQVDRTHFFILNGEALFWGYGIVSLAGRHILKRNQTEGGGQCYTLGSGRIHGGEENIPDYLQVNEEDGQYLEAC